MSEEWRAIPGHEGAYEVSNLGRVRSLDRVVRKTTGPARYRGRVLRPARRTRGSYLSVVLADAGELRPWLIHELVAVAFIGPRPGGAWIAHDDGDPTNNTAANLRYDSPKGNHADKLRHGTLKHSERHHNARLSSSDVSEIRGRRKRERGIDLAVEFGAHPNHIYRICARKRWRHAA